jgi:hypothetical protein
LTDLLLILRDGNYGWLVLKSKVEWGLEVGPVSRATSDVWYVTFIEAAKDVVARVNIIRRSVDRDQAQGGTQGHLEK